MSICGKTKSIVKEVKDKVSYKPIGKTDGFVDSIDCPDSLVEHYRRLWRTATVTNRYWVDRQLDKIMKKSGRYLMAEKLTGVPWFIIAVLHMRESNFSFSKNLMNGQPLNRVTTWVPKGYGPWSTWEESAIDAMRHDRLAARKYEDIDDVLYAIERFNGIGYLKYRMPNDKLGRKNGQGWTYSPYLWAMTDHYILGGYPSDGKWSATYKNKQVGCAAILKRMEQKGFVSFNTGLVSAA